MCLATVDAADIRGLDTARLLCVSRSCLTLATGVAAEKAGDGKVTRQILGGRDFNVIFELTRQ